MNENTGKLALGLLVLVAVWMMVYWLAPASPRVTFAEQSGGLIAPVDGAGTKPTVASGEPGPVGGSNRTAKEVPRIKPGTTNAPAPDSAGGRSKGPSEKPSTEKGPDARGGVIAPEFFDHVVAPGETFDTIAAKYYGKRGRGSVVARANPFVDPRRLKPGRVLKVPKDPSNIQGIEVVPDASGEAFVVVQSGDTLSSISQQHFGTITMAEAIFEANRDTLSSPDDLAVGQRIRLPRKDDR